MSTRSGRLRSSIIETSPSRSRKGISPPRSPGRTRKISPPVRKSSPPARTNARKSPSRKSPSRKPAEKAKYPARKSPSRTTKDVTNKDSIEPAAPRSPVKRQAIKSDVSVKLEDFTTNLEIFRSTRSKQFEYSIKDFSSDIVSNDTNLDKQNGIEDELNDIFSLRNRKPVEEVAPRRSSRLREFIDNVPDFRRSLSRSVSKSISKSVSKSVSKSIDTYSDENSEEEFQKEKSKSVTRRLATPLTTSITKSFGHIGERWEFGGRLGSALLLLLLPLTVFTILISCSKSCSLKLFNNYSILSSFSVWFNLKSYMIILAQLAIQAIFALIPVFGTKADRMDESGIKYCFNAFFASIFSVSLLFVLDFFKIFAMDVLLNDYLTLAVASYTCAAILSIAMYLKSLKTDNTELNLYGNTGYMFYDFFMGREIHPHVKNLDVKVWVSRCSSISALILGIIIFKQGLHLPLKENDVNSLQNYKELLNKVHLKPTVLLFSMMQITYILNFIMREYKMTTTFFWHSEGVGYLQIVSSSLYPLYFTTISKFIVDTGLSLSTNILITAFALYMLGFFIMLISNNIKYEFRKNPLHPYLTHLESMPTFHGKKLIVSGIWGIMRHPNYTGDILVHLALAIPGIVSEQYIAAMPAILTILVLIHRARRDHLRCKRRYGAAWQRYCKKVPSVLIPNFFNH